MSGEENNTNDSNADEWTKYEDDEGQTYYYNAATGESSWEVPEGAIIKKMILRIIQIDIKYI